MRETSDRLHTITCVCLNEELCMCQFQYVDSSYIYIEQQIFLVHRKILKSHLHINPTVKYTNECFCALMNFKTTPSHLATLS